MLGARLFTTTTTFTCKLARPHYPVLFTRFSLAFSEPVIRRRTIMSATNTAAKEARRAELVENLKAIQEKVRAHSKATFGDANAVRLVAVSKTKPVEDIQILYEAGHRHFGENYVQELVEKSEKLPKDICWHFIGSLQSNKCKILANIPNLWAIETVDTQKRAQLLERACQQIGRTEPLRVFVQVNTSGEESKSGGTVDEAVDLCYFIHEYCPHLSLVGLMTIGAPGRQLAPGQVNPDFLALRECRDKVIERTNLENIELSMGMSDDFAEAIDAGSTNVRVGSSIFGARQYKC